MLTKPNDDKLVSNKTSLNKLNKHQKNIISPTKNNNTITNNNPKPLPQPINMKSIMLSLKNNTIDYLKT